MIKKNTFFIVKTTRLWGIAPTSFACEVSQVLIIILSILCLTFPIYAEENSGIYLETNKSIIEKEEEIELTLNIANEKVAAYSANIYFDLSKFEFVSGPENINVEENKVNLVWYDLEGGSGAKTGKLEELTFKAKENGSTDFIVEGEFFNEKGELIETNSKPIQIQIGKEEGIFKEEFKEEQGTDNNSTNTNLKDLRVNEVGLVPEFNKDIFDYDITVENSVQDLEILALSENPNSKIEVSRKYAAYKKDLI